MASFYDHGFSMSAVNQQRIISCLIFLLLSACSDESSESIKALPSVGVPANPNSELEPEVGSIPENAPDISDQNEQLNENPDSASPSDGVNQNPINIIPSLNDTGIVTCGDYAFDAGSSLHDNTVDCALQQETSRGFDPVPVGQDGHYGRDIELGSSDNSDGVAGFSFTKLAAVGGYDLDSSVQNWGCVRDNVTGLVWEVKTKDLGMRDYRHIYTWFDSKYGGFAGYGDTGSFTTTVQGNKRGSDSCFDKSRCDTEKFVVDVNSMAEPLCGYADWRLPTIMELSSIIHYGGEDPTIDTKYFPNTYANFYWTGTPSVDNQVLLDFDQAWAVNFASSRVDTSYKNYANAVRLVRSQGEF